MFAQLSTIRQTANQRGVGFKKRLISVLNSSKKDPCENWLLFDTKLGLISKPNETTNLKVGSVAPASVPEEPKMVFNTNQAFKLISFVWADYDARSKTFKRSGFFGTIIPYLWSRFFWAVLVGT